jgi:hypothetical protein
MYIIDYIVEWFQSFSTDLENEAHKYYGEFFKEKGEDGVDVPRDITKYGRACGEEPRFSPRVWFCISILFYTVC